MVLTMVGMGLFDPLGYAYTFTHFCGLHDSIEPGGHDTLHYDLMTFANCLIGFYIALQTLASSLLFVLSTGFGGCVLLRRSVTLLGKHR